MKIELKKIDFSELLSEETNAFAAYLYIDGKRVGYAKNEGRGGNTFYQPLEPQHRDIIQEAEKWCLRQPDLFYPATRTKAASTLPSTLEDYIDWLLHNYLVQKDLQKHKQKKIRYMRDHIVLQDTARPDQFRTVKLELPISELLQTKQGRTSIVALLVRTRPDLKDGMKIANTNIPEILFINAGISEQQHEKVAITPNLPPKAHKPAKKTNQ